MIIRKPYAFLMKNFRKIHILLLALSIFVFFKTNIFLTFVKQYMNTKVYNPLVESVKVYASDFLFLSILLIIAIIGTVIFLLKRKKKPIIDYIVVLAVYAFLFIVFFIGKGDFNNAVNQAVSERSIRLLRDLLSIGLIPQYLIFVLLIVRILGIDLNRFGFKQDEEFNEISEDDREEVEVAVEFDKDVYKRELKKRVRFLKYYYKENTLFLNIIFAIVTTILVGTIVVVILNGDKNVSQGRSFSSNGYEIVINNSYLSKYDLSGSVIENKNSFIVLDVEVVNHYSRRLMDVEKFLLITNDHVYVPTLKYNNYFKDLGKGYVKNEFKKNSTNRFLLIYRIPDKTLKENKVIYYQNIKGAFKHNYIKVKLKPVDLTTSKNSKEVYLNKNLDVKGKKLNIESYEIGDRYSYLHKKCEVDNCFIESSDIYQDGKKVMKINLDTTDFDGYSFVDFLDTYGKIIYRIDGKKNEVKVKNPISRKYNGDSSYIIVEPDIERADYIYLLFKVRNTNYKYYLKGEKGNEKVSK